MVTLRVPDLTSSQESLNAPRQRCIHCRRLIIWLATCHGRDFAFEPDPELTKYDDGSGWAPGQFMVGGKLRFCFAPLPLHPPAKRRRIANVMRLHRCRSAA